MEFDPQNAWHKGRLELIIRLMDCNDLEPSSLDDIRDALDYYVESAADDDGTVTATAPAPAPATAPLTPPP
jgi:CCR4-NOT transcriptional regulation complex NOT5 subunit